MSSAESRWRLSLKPPISILSPTSGVLNPSIRPRRPSRYGLSWRSQPRSLSPEDNDEAPAPVSSGRSPAPETEPGRAPQVRHEPGARQEQPGAHDTHQGQGLL